MSDNNIIEKSSVFFFDMDGTLVDTNYANYLSYKKAVKQLKKIDFEIIYDPINRFDRSSLNNVIPNLTEMEFSLIVQEKERCYNDFLSETLLNKTIADVLYRYYQLNKTVLVTNSLKDRALATLNYHGLMDKFSDWVFKGSDRGIAFNKYQHAISVLGISPKLVIAFENDDKEIENARIAGIQNINPI